MIWDIVMWEHSLEHLYKNYLFSSAYCSPSCYYSPLHSLCWFGDSTGRSFMGGNVPQRVELKEKSDHRDDGLVWIFSCWNNQPTSPQNSRWGVCVSPRLRVYFEQTCNANNGWNYQIQCFTLIEWQSHDYRTRSCECDEKCFQHSLGMGRNASEHTDGVSWDGHHGFTHLFFIVLWCSLKRVII